MLSTYNSVLLLPVVALLCLGKTGEPIDVHRPANQPATANVGITNRSVSKIQSTAPGGRDIIISKAPDGLFYMSGMINGTAVRFLIDTGANMVILTSNDARRLGLASSTSRMNGKIETAGGQSQMGRVSLDAVDVAGHHIESVEAAVMPDGLRVSLLGQNLLSKLGQISIAGDELTFQRSR
jgi:aspartyl protease family protein